MPSVTDIQQQSSNTHGKSTSPLPTQQTTSMDLTNADPITQAILVVDKKQRNLGKRKEKLESYHQEANKGKELHKDQKDALSKYPEVLGQIECAKELSEQLKKIQTESLKNQKRLSKQMAEEKRSQISQRLREYAQIRYLLDHRPTSLKPEESSLLDELSPIIIPSDNSINTISRSVDTVLTFYQGGPLSSSIKTQTGKTPQEIREIFEQIIQNSNTISSSVPSPPSEQEQTKELDQTNDIQSLNKTINEYPVQFDTRDQNIPFEQIIDNSSFFPDDLTKTQLIQDNQIDQSTDPKQFLQTFTVINSTMIDQPLSTISNQQQDTSSNVVPSTDEQQQQRGEQWQQHRGTGNTHRGGHYQNGVSHRNYNRSWPNNYHQRQWRGQRGGHYDNSYNDGQRQYNENTRGRGRPNPHYRGNRGGNYRGNNRGYNGHGNEYQKSPPYQQHPVRSAPPTTHQ